MASPPDLGALRQEIDRIDAQMHALLLQRGEIVGALIKAKKTGESGSAFRPLREAQMMERFLERHKGSLPVELVVHIWRQIISTFTYQQAPYKVHMLAKLREKARFHFGFGVPFIEHQNLEAVIKAVDFATGDLGFLPLYKPKQAWWDLLIGENAPKIMALSPVTLRNGQRLEAAIIARKEATDFVGLTGEVMALRLKESDALTGALAQVGNSALYLRKRGEDLPINVESAHHIGYTALPFHL